MGTRKLPDGTARSQSLTAPADKLPELAYDALLRYADSLWKPREELLPKLMRLAIERKETL